MQNAQTFESGIAGFSIRTATEADVPLILAFIKKMAVYEKLENEVSATEGRLHRSLFETGRAHALIGEKDGKPVAFAVYFFNFSTFTGCPGLYLEDLFVDESCRGMGYGGAFFKALATIALQNECRRMEWSCLDWNVNSIAFYKGLGAVPMDDWTVYRLREEGIHALIEA